MTSATKKSPIRTDGSTAPVRAKLLGDRDEITDDYDKLELYDKLAVAFAITIFTLSALGLWKVFEIIKALV